MARKIIQDIIVKDKKNDHASKKIEAERHLFFREKIYDNNDDVFAKKLNELKDKEHMFEKNDDSEFPKEKVSKNSVYFLWALGFALIVTIVFLLSSVFATAKIIITPKNTDLSMSDTYTASDNKDAAGLHYEIMTVEKTMSKSLPTSGEESVERKAIGKVTIYNKYSTQTQRLINNTRLETPDGLIYRIRESVDVPGMSGSTPGSVTVDVIADESGDKYNMNVSDLKGDFTIPGFAGSPKFDGFFARISSDITGGYIGNVKSVSNNDLTAGRNQLKNDLQTELIKEVYDQKPDGYLIFDNNYYTDMNDLPDNSSTSDYSISEDGTIHAIIFSRSDLADFLAKNKISGFDGSEVDILPGDDFTSSISGTTAQPWNEHTLKISFSGNIKIVWVYNGGDIISDIAGQNKSVIPAILDKYKTSVEAITASINPSWVKTFPKNPKKISIVDSVTGNSI